ncbi:MAG: ZIP family metal transporter [Candidatus Nanoarchaeia archaeon]
MHIQLLYTIISIMLVSLISLIGIITLGIKTERLKKILIFFLAFSAGAMLGDAFIHLLPETVESYGLTLQVSLFILLGIAFSFLVEKLIHWRHCHMPITKQHVHPYAKMNLIGDFVHNIIDGIIIAASYLVSIPVGIATTIAVLIHEIPQEISDFGVLLHGGFSKRKALLYNFLTALSSIIGAVIAILIGSRIENSLMFFAPFTIGTFIYIAGADLIPELHKETKPLKSLLQFIFFAAGIGVMALLLLIG